MDDAVAHEAGHDFLSLYARARRPGGLRAPVRVDTSAVYGSPFLPDWIDETVPKLMERIDSTGREERRVNLAQNTARIPLRTFLSMEHPTILVRRLAAPNSSGGTQQVMLQGDLGKLTSTFYDQAAVFGEFLISRGGEPVIGQLVEAFANGSTFSELLGKVRGLPPTLEQLEAEWLAWLGRGGAR